jgi:hypothetical protein
LGLLVLDEFDYSPQNNQRWPVSPEPVQQWLRAQNVHGGEQKHHAQQD